MADKRNAPGAPEGAHRRKHAAPTIDLTATEIRAPANNDPTPTESASPPQAAPEPPPAPPDQPEQPEQPADAASEAQPPSVQSNSWFNTTVLAAGLVGGGIAALAMGVLWYLTMPQPADSSAQIAALQKQIQNLQSRPTAVAPPTIDTKAVDALSRRVAAMENALANLPKSDSGIALRLAAAEDAMKSLTAALAALNRRGDDIAANATQARARAEAAEKAVTDLRASVQNVEKSASSAVAPAELDALQQRMAALEQTAKAAREEIAATAAAEKIARLALSAAALRNAVASGAAYDAELKQAKSLGADDKTLAPLAAFAAAGMPSAAMLAQELRTLLPSMLKASGAQAPQGGFLERLQANASKLVRIAPVDAPPGDDPSATLARIEIAAAHDDIAVALADLAKLPDAARAPAEGWIKKAKARQAALAAAQNFAAASARALGQPERAR